MNKEVEPMKSVYSFLPPEVWRHVEAVDKLENGRLLYLIQTPVEVAQAVIEPLGFTPRLELPSTPEGHLALDKLHFVVAPRIREAYREVMPGLEQFSYAYPTAGSSEGIFHVFNQLRREGVRQVVCLHGEYEGYEHNADKFEIEVSYVDYDVVNPRKMPRSVWFISNPNARDGNILSDAFIREVCDAGHRVIYDVAYIGSTYDHVFDVSHPNIETVLWSASKPYGLFRQRIGWTFSRREIASLIPNMWFKQDRSVILGLKVVEQVGPKALPPKYKPIQEEIVAEFNAKTQLGVHGSDAFLVAFLPKIETFHLDQNQLAYLQRFKRDNGEDYRFCLTPFFELKESLDYAEIYSR